MGSLAIGLVAIFLGGVVSGLFTAPIVYIKHWAWWNIWLVYCLYGCVLLPWSLVFFTVKDASEVYSSAPPKDVGLAVGFGALWGMGSVAFGVGVDAVGAALGFSLILGLTSALGSAIPLLVLHTDEASKKEGIFTWIGLVIVIFGLTLLAVAGRKKEHEQGVDSEESVPLNFEGIPAHPPKKKRSFTAGLVICVISGVLSPALNLAIAFGKGVGDEAERRGTSKSMANNSILALAVTAGFFSNALYCIVLIIKNGSFHNYGKGTFRERLRNFGLCALMGLMWFGGNVSYGLGVNTMPGDLGTSVGWVIFIVSMIMTGVVVGVLSGEWKNTTMRSRGWLIGGLALMISAVAVTAVGSV